MFLQDLSLQVKVYLAVMTMKEYSKLPRCGPIWDTLFWEEKGLRLCLRCQKFIRKAIVLVTVLNRVQTWTNKQTHRYVSFTYEYEREFPRGVMVKALGCGIVVSEFLLVALSLSGKYPWERYELPYPSSYGLNSHHHHHVALVARISLSLSRHSSLSFIALGRFSGQHPVSSHSC